MQCKFPLMPAGKLKEYQPWVLEFWKVLLDIGTQTFTFLLMKSDIDVENINFVQSLARRDMKLPFICKLRLRSKIQTSLEDKLSEVHSSLQLTPPASKKSLFCPVSFAHVLLQQLPAPQVILFYMWTLQNIKSCYALVSCVMLFVKDITCHAVPCWNIPLYFFVLHFHNK